MPAVADTRIGVVETITTDGRETATKATIWIGHDHVARVGDGLRLVLDGASGSLHLIDDDARTVRTLPTRPMGSGAPVNVVEQGAMAEVNGWRATRYDLRLEILGEPASLTVWMSEDTGLNRAAYFDYLERSDGDLGLAAVLSELPGIPVQQRLIYGVVEGRLRLEDVSEAEPPVGVYDVPTDYTEQ